MPRQWLTRNAADAAECKRVREIVRENPGATDSQRRERADERPLGVDDSRQNRRQNEAAYAEKEDGKEQSHAFVSVDIGLKQANAHQVVGTSRVKGWPGRGDLRDRSDAHGFCRPRRGIQQNLVPSGVTRRDMDSSKPGGGCSSAGEFGACNLAQRTACHPTHTQMHRDWGRCHVHHAQPTGTRRSLQRRTP